MTKELKTYRGIYYCIIVIEYNIKTNLFYNIIFIEKLSMNISNYQPESFNGLWVEYHSSNLLSTCKHFYYFSRFIPKKSTTHPIEKLCIRL